MPRPTPPPRIKIPEFSYRPEPGSCDIAPIASSVPTVSATSLQGGYPDVDKQMVGLPDTKSQNTQRLVRVVWGSKQKHILKAILGARLSCNNTAFLRDVLQNVLEQPEPTTSTTWSRRQYKSTILTSMFATMPGSPYSADELFRTSQMAPSPAVKTSPMSTKLPPSSSVIVRLLASTP